MDYAKHLTTQTLLGNANIAPLDAIPLDMRGSANAHEQTWQQDDWIEWHTVASPLTEADIAAFEQRFAIALPQQFKQYLLACCHLFDEMPTQGFAENVYLAHTPSNAPLAPLTHLINSALPLLEAGYLPIGDWGLGYGPVCFDVGQRATPLEDAAIVWFDHEQLLAFNDEQLQQRQLIAPCAQPLYSSFLECFDDVYAAPEGEELRQLLAELAQ